MNEPCQHTHDGDEQDDLEDAPTAEEDAGETHG